MNFRLQNLLFVAIAGLLLSGCAGYQLGDVKPSIYEGIHSIHVPTFRNQTLEPRLSSLVTNAVLAELQSDGTYKISNRSNADAVLVGTIKEIRKRQLRAVRTDTLRSQELRLNLVVEFHLENPVTGARIDGGKDSKTPYGGESFYEGESEDGETLGARQGRVIGETIQFVDPSFQVGERNSLAVAAENVAEKLVAQLVNGW